MVSYAVSDLLQRFYSMLFKGLSHWIFRGFVLCDRTSPHVSTSSIKDQAPAKIRMGRQETGRIRWKTDRQRRLRKVAHVLHTWVGMIDHRCMYQSCV